MLILFITKLKSNCKKIFLKNRLTKDFFFKFRLTKDLGAGRVFYIAFDIV